MPRRTCSDSAARVYAVTSTQCLALDSFLSTAPTVDSTMQSRLWLFTGALLGCVAVALGAFAAHGLKSYLGTSGDEWSAKLANWETAARYQMYHALALLAVGLLAERHPSVCIHVAGASMTLGTLIFS